MSVCKLYYDHSYPKKLFTRSGDAYIDFQTNKSAQRHNFRISSSLIRQFQGSNFDENSCIFIKNAKFSCFAAAYELRNVPNVFENILSMFSNLKLIGSDEG